LSPGLRTRISTFVFTPVDCDAAGAVTVSEFVAAVISGSAEVDTTSSPLDFWVTGLSAPGLRTRTETLMLPASACVAVTTSGVS
jgi:hypothetical protein